MGKRGWEGRQRLPEAGKRERQEGKKGRQAGKREREGWQQALLQAALSVAVAGVLAVASVAHTGQLALLQAISGLRWQEAFLVVAAAVGVDEGYETVELGVVRGEREQALDLCLKSLYLVLVAFGGAFRKQVLNPVRDEEFRSAATVGSSVDRYPEFREEDADSGEVEVAEMQIAVRDALQPGD